jgi:hypothetical protein
VKKRDKCQQKCQNRNTVSEDQEGRGETIPDTGSIRMPTAKRNSHRAPRNLYSV